MEPGTIRKSRVSSSCTKSLQGWINFISNHFMRATSDQAPTSAGDVSIDAITRCSNLFFASARLFALEKACDTLEPRYADTVKVAMEVVLFMKVTTKQTSRQCTIPVTNLVTGL